LRCEGNGANREHAKKTELDRQYLIGSRDLHWNSHRKLLILVLGRLLILLDEEATTSLQNAPIWLQLGPNLKRTIALYETERGVELKVRFEVLGEGQLDFHSIGTSVVQDDFLSVELLVDENVQVVLLLLNIDGHINASSIDGDRNRFRVILVLQEESKAL